MVLSTLVCHGSVARSLAYFVLFAFFSFWLHPRQQKHLVMVLVAVGAAAVGANTPLHRAATSGDAALVASLLDAGADAGAATASGVRPLHLAALKDRQAAAAVLVRRGADVDAGDGRGRTPLHRATDAGVVRMVQWLLLQGARADAADDAGVTPLQVAVRKNNPAVLDAYRFYHLLD